MSISVKINNEEVSFPDQQPRIFSNRTFVPIDPIFEHMGFEVYWTPGTGPDPKGTATLTSSNYTIVVTEGEAAFTTNGVTYYHSDGASALIIGGRVMVPVRSILESIGCSVDWDGATQTVIVVTNVEPSIELSDNSITLNINETARLSVVGQTVPSGTTVNWSPSQNGAYTIKSSDNASAVIEAWSTLEGVEDTITASFTYNGNTYSDSCTVNVNGILGEDIFIISNSGNGLPLSDILNGTLLQTYPVIQSEAHRRWKISKVDGYYYIQNSEGKYIAAQSGGYTLQTGITGACAFSITPVVNPSNYDESQSFNIKLGETKLGVTWYYDNNTLQNSGLVNWRFVLCGSGSFKYGFDSLAPVTLGIINDFNNNGANYKFAGKYISTNKNGSSRLTPIERNLLLSNNIPIVSLYENYWQVDNGEFFALADPEKTAKEIGIEHALIAISRAIKIYGQPSDTAIYFCLEPPTTATEAIIQACNDYMSGVNEVFSSSVNARNYKIGFYSYSHYIHYLGGRNNEYNIQYFFLAASYGMGYYSTYNLSTFYDIRQMLFKTYSSIYVDPDMTYKDDIGQWDHIVEEEE